VDEVRIEFGGETLVGRRGQTLRAALKAAGRTPHNGETRWFNCKGFGSCGTCAVRIEGPVSPPNTREAIRFRIPPHHPDSGLRLACQARLEGDVRVTKHPGFWGHEVPRGRVRVSQVADD
jgi:ferredoxin